MIKAEFFRDEKIGALSHMARLLFLSMLVHCDDSGVGRAATRILRADAFPYDENTTSGQVEAAFKETVDVGITEAFESGGEKYYKICNFNKHQTINRPSAFRFIGYNESSSNSGDGSCELHEDSLMKVKEKVKEKGKEVVAAASGSSVFVLARKAFRNIVGRGIGSLGEREKEWDGLVAKHGQDAILLAVRLWAKENRDFLRHSKYGPITHFLKNSAEFIEAAEARTTESPSGEADDDGFIEDTTTPTVDDIRPPDYAPLKRNVQ